MQKSLLLFLVFLTIGSYCLFDDSKVIKMISTSEQYNEIRNGNSDHLSFLFFYEEDC